eukprot:IDg6879t1
MWGTKVIFIRSGITNTLLWFFIELAALCAIEFALFRIQNFHLTKIIESGKKIQIKESKIPVVGNGLLAHGLQSRLFMFFRTGLLVSFVWMNLGIDGSKEKIYETRTLHSQLELRSVSDGNKHESDYDRPYAQMHNPVLIKCVRVITDEQRFIVYKPVFNLTNATTNATVSALVVQNEGSLCLDGVLTRENETFITGDLLGTESNSEPMKDGKRFRLKSERGRRGRLGIDKLSAGHLLRPSRIIKSKQIGQAVNCLFIFEQNELAIFSVKASWLNNIYLPPDQVPQITLGTRARAVRLKLNLSLSKEVHRDIAQRLLLAEPTYQVAPMIATILKYHYSATMDRKPFNFAVHVDDQLATRIEVHAICIAVVVILVAAALITTAVLVKSCCISGKINITVNTINGLSKILAFEHINEGSCAAPGVLAEIGLYEANPSILRVGPANTKICVPVDER